MIFFDKELRSEIKKSKKELIYYAKEKKKLLNAKIDYNFLETLINQSNENRDLIITVKFKSGDVLTLSQKIQNDKKKYSYIDDIVVE